MKCKFCNNELVGGLDTFGDAGLESCWDCFIKNPEVPDVYYGLAPHKHKYDEQGNIIFGGTTFETLPDGEIVVNGYTFTPDPEAPGCGIYRKE